MTKRFEIVNVDLYTGSFESVVREGEDATDALTKYFDSIVFVEMDDEEREDLLSRVRKCNNGLTVKFEEEMFIVREIG